MNSMKLRGFTLIELLIAIAAGVIVIGGSIMALKGLSTTAVASTEAAAASSKLELTINRLKEDLGSKPLSVILPGSNDSHLTLVYAAGNGVYAQSDPNFSSATSVKVNSPAGAPVAAGDPAMIINSTGQVLFIPAVNNVTTINSDTYQIDHDDCANATPWTPDVRLFPVHVIYIASGSDVPDGDPHTIYRKVDGGAWEPISFNVEDFKISYLYKNFTGNIIHDPQYGVYTASAPAPILAPAANRNDHYSLYALSIYTATHVGQVQRDYNGQIPLSGNLGSSLRTVAVCGGASTSHGNPPTGGGVGGDLNVTIAGLPAGQDASVDLGGPSGYSNHLTASATLRGLATGSYTLTSHDVWSDAYTAWGGSPATQTATVTSWTPANATVTYSKVLVDLTVSMTGLPAGVDGDATASGPGGFYQSLTSGRVFHGLEPGSGYRVTARNVWSDALTEWQPTPADQSFDLVSYHPYTASVAYAYVPCALAVNVVGLPAGTAADVTVSGPAGFSRHLTGNASWPAVRPGNYSASGNIVSAGGYDYEVASVNPDPAACKSGESQTITVTYAKMVGSIVTDVNGPPGDSPAPGVGLLRYRQPSYHYNTSGRHVENDAKTGNYTVKTNSAGPKEITDQATGIKYWVKYNPSSNADHFTLRRGQTVHVSVNYAVVKGHIREPGGRVRDVDPGVYRPGDFGYWDSETTNDVKEETSEDTCAFVELRGARDGDTCHIKYRSYLAIDSTDYTPRVFGVSSGETKSVNEDTSHTEYTNLVHTENYSYYEDDDGNVNSQLNSETYDSYEYCRNDRNKIVGTRYTGTLTKTYVYDDDHNYLYTVVNRNGSDKTCPP